MAASAIPVIDLAAPRALLVDQLTRAARRPGFFQVLNSGIPPAVLRSTLEITRQFFACDIDSKRALSRTLENPFGYYDRELTRNLRDRKEIFDYAPGELTPWPSTLPGLRPALEQFAERCHALGLRLTDLLCDGLGEPSQRFQRYLTPSHSSFLRLNHYPVDDLLAGQAEPPGPLGISPHTDAGLLTVLLQDAVPGLRMQQDDAWIDVPPLEGALTINIGDMLQVGSNDQFVAPLHRVRASASQPRLSIAYFLNPGYHAVIEPWSGGQGMNTAPGYRPVPWREFRGLRALGDFGDYGEEVQISHYRL